MRLHVITCYKKELFPSPRAWYGMEWKMEWNGTEISVWNMEDARMESNGRFQERNERQSSILPYQLHIRFRALYLQKNTYRCRVVINNIVTEVFNFNIYACYVICRQIAVLWLCTLRKQCTYCVVVSTVDDVKCHSTIKSSKAY